jgi:hypothetical protein
MKKLITFFLAVSFFGAESNAAPPVPGSSRSCDQSSLAQVVAPAPVSPPLVPGAPALKLAYHAIFPGASLSCFMDRIHSTPQALEQGEGQVAGQSSSFTAGTLGVVLHLTTPDPIPLIPSDPDGNTQTSSVGLFSTGLNFGPGTFFSARATFVGPNGPFGGKSWAVTVNARTGGKQDLGTATRLNMTLRFKGGTAALNAFEAGDSRGSTPVPMATYNAIVSSSQPFTLELMVSRITGKGAAILTTAGAVPLYLTFALSTFGSTSGPVISAVGPALANCCAAGKTASVEVTDFQILAHPSTLPPH